MIYVIYVIYMIHVIYIVIFPMWETFPASRRKPPPPQRKPMHEEVYLPSPLPNSRRISIDPTHHFALAPPFLLITRSSIFRL